MMTPAELHYALEDFEETHYRPAKNICEVLRLHAQIVRNSAFGMKKSDMILDPKKIMKFTWEQNTEIKVQSVDTMKDQINALAKSFGAVKGRSHRI